MKLLMIVGSSGSGKSYVENTLTLNHPDIYSRVISLTTRPKRDGEVNGVHYHFINENEVDLINFIESNVFKGFTYGTTITSFHKSKINVLVIEPIGLKTFVDYCNSHGHDYNILYMNLSQKSRELGLFNREGTTSLDVIKDRLQDDINLTYELMFKDNDNYRPDVTINKFLDQDQLLFISHLLGHSDA